jgi:hypothetical protein
MSFHMMVFGRVVSLVGSSFAPVYNLLALADSVADPVESHVHCF